MDVSNLNYLLALGTVAMQIVTGALLVVFLLRKNVPMFNDIVAQVGSFGLRIAFLVAFVASGMTIYYESLGFAPCPLCWWQRVELYPQVILLGMAVWRECYRRAAIDFSIATSIIGAGIALYHHALQMLPGSGLPCPATGVSCAQRIFFEFGYVTYPLMAFSVFAFLIVVMLIVRSRR
jgi:disulfide bond formation protein DsbB